MNTNKTFKYLKFVIKMRLMQFMFREEDMQSRSFTYDDNIFVIHISSTNNFNHQRK